MSALYELGMVAGILVAAGYIIGYWAGRISGRVEETNRHNAYLNRQLGLERDCGSNR